MLTEFSGNLAHHLEFGHALEIVAKTIDGASRYTTTLNVKCFSMSNISNRFKCLPGVIKIRLFVVGKTIKY